MGPIKALILAAGKGTRMESDLPKVIHRIDGECLADYVIDAARGAGADEVCLVVGYQAERVKQAIAHKDVRYVLQEQQLGTGHAVKCAADFLGQDGETMILFGDTPLITADTLRHLVAHHRENHNAVTVLSAMVEDASGYGRILRDGQGHFVKSVEDKDATEAERQIREINSGMYIFHTASLQEALGQLRNDNAQGEYYLPDALEILKSEGKRVDAYRLEDAEDVTGVNTQQQLLEAAEVIRRRKAASEQGTT